MAARLISYEDVAKACNELVAAGEEPSIIKIHKMLGKGSPNTVQKFIKQWRESDEAKAAKTEQLPAVIQLPESFKGEAELFLKKIFKLAEAEHDAAIERNNLEKEQAIAKADAEIKEAMEYAEGISATNEELTGEVEQLKKQIAELDVKNGSLQNQLDEAHKENADLEEELETAAQNTEELASVISELEQKVALLEQERDMAVKSVETTKAEHEQEVKDLKADHQQELKTLKAEHSDTLKEIKAENAKLIKDIKADNAKAIKDLTAANDKATKALTTANDKTIKSLEASLSDAQKQRDSYAEKLAILEQQGDS